MKKSTIVLIACLFPNLYGQADLQVSLTRIRGYDSTAGVWTWFNDPRAIYHNDNIYFGAVDNAGNIKIVQHKCSADSTFVASLGYFQKDDHDNPGLRLTRDNKIEVYYSKHSDRDYFRQRTTNAEDISSWNGPVNLDDVYGLSNYSYANIIELGDTIFNFFRATPADGGIYTMHYSKSVDDGITWTIPVKLLTGERPYFRVIKNGANRIDIICNDGHPNKTDTNSTYHFYYQQGGWHGSNGTGLGSPPFTPSEDLMVIYDGKNMAGKSWVWDVKINRSGNPVCVFNTTGTETAHKYHYAFWDGNKWEVKTLVENAGTFLYSAEAQYSGGMSIDPDKTSVVYCSVETGGLHKLWRYETTDNGDSWNAIQLTKEKAFRPFVISGAPAGRRILYIAGTYTTYTDFSTYVKFVSGY